MKKDPNYYSWDFDLFAYKEQGKYVKYIKKWYELFPKENFLILQITYHETLAFLNLTKWEPEKYILTKKRDYLSPIKDTTREKLKKFFQPHNEELYQLINKKFDWD